MPHKFFIEKRPHHGLTYENYSKELHNYIETTNPDDLNERELKLYKFIKLNICRSNRVLKTYKPNNEIIEAIQKIKSEQIWMLLTEGWCGDSAQTVPYIYMIARCSPNIKFRILFRNSNLDIMDKYLVNGKSRSIPRLVVFDKEGNELAVWGPRPADAQKLVDKLKAEGKNMPYIHEKLHLWYGRNRGKSIEMEFLEIANRVSAK